MGTPINDVELASSPLIPGAGRRQKVAEINYHHLRDLVWYYRDKKLRNSDEKLKKIVLGNLKIVLKSPMKR